MGGRGAKFHNAHSSLSSLQKQIDFCLELNARLPFLLCSHYSICCGFSSCNEVEEHGSHSAIATVSVLTSVHG